MALQLVHIPDLPAAVTLNSTDQYAIEQSDGTKRITQSIVDAHNAGQYIKKNVNDSTTGVLTAAGFTVSSSIKFKEDIQPLSDNLIDSILKLNPVSYKFKADSPIKPGQRDVGLIAEEVQALIPELTTVDSNGNLSIDYSKLSVYLLLVLKQLVK